VLGAAAVTAAHGAGRLTGFARNLVFAKTVGFTCLADTYTSVNTCRTSSTRWWPAARSPAWSSAARPAVGSGDREHVSRDQLGVAHLGGAVLAPVALLVAGLPSRCRTAAVGREGLRRRVEVGASMLRVIAPQVWL
jgi:hypothetical protein